MRPAAVLALVVSLLPHQAVAQSLPLRQSIRLSTEKLLLEQTQTQEQGIPPGLLWTGISLIGAGGLFLAAGVGLVTDERCGSECDADLPVVFGVGGVLAGTGMALLIIGKNRASSRVSPELAATPGGVALRGRITLGRRSSSK